MKSYTEELTEWVEKRAQKKRRQDAAAVAFLAVRPDVKAAIEAGYALITIWEHMQETGKVKCSYETFRKHVRRFLKPTEEKPDSIRESTALASTRKECKNDQKTPEPARQKTNEQLHGFSFNAKPNKEDLF